MASNWSHISNHRRADILAFDLLAMIDVPEPVERSVRVPGFSYTPNDVLAAFLADEAAEYDLEAYLVVLSLLDEEAYKEVLVKAADSLIMRVKRGN